MKKLTYPYINSIELWDKIISHKHKGIREKLFSYRDKLCERYTFYEKHTNSLDKVIPLLSKEWDDVKDDLIACYGNNVEFKIARKKIFENLSITNKTKCPYCMLNRPNTLDHYFDKNDYPEFAVFVPNLIPCCSECNYSKGVSMFDIHNKRKYIHFYYDEIPEKQFLFFRFTFSDGKSIPTVNISLKINEQDESSNLIRRHFLSLALLEKYRNAALDRLAPIIEEIYMYKQSNMSDESIINSLRIRHHSLQSNYGINYWETCIYEGILSSQEFLKQLFQVYVCQEN